MAKLTPPQIAVATLIQRVRAAPVIPTTWLSVSDVMAHVRIESGFDASTWGTPQWGSIKASDYDLTGSVGLMQPTAATASAILALYDAEIKASGLPVTADMADPLSNIVVGMMTLYDLKGPLSRRFSDPLAYCHLAVGYNAGQAAAEQMSYDEALGFPYYIKWASVQPQYAFLDAVTKRVAA